MAQRILSISGLRGVIGDGLDPQYLVEFASGLGTWFQGGTVILSRDGRGTGEMVRHSVLAGLLATGCRVLDAGIASTPTCGVLVKAHEAAGGLQITASHNPIEWNGLKPFAPRGSVIDSLGGAQVLDIIQQRAFGFRGWEGLGTLEAIADPSAPHLERVLSLVDTSAIRKRKLKVALDCNHGSGGILGPRLLEALGCEVTVFGAQADGRFEHVPEPTEQNLVNFCNDVRRVGADVGFAQDPDADRLAIVDENGRYIGEELTLALCVDFILAKRPGPVVVNGSTSRTTADIAQRYGCAFHRSHVGEVNVVNKMEEVGAVVGGEGNGGLIDPQVGFVRDSFAAMAYVLAGLTQRQTSLSAWVETLPKYAIVKDKLTCTREQVVPMCEALQRHYSDAIVTLGDGLRLDWPDRWLQVRASNTEPIARMIAEAPDTASARKLCDEGLSLAKSVAGL